MLPEPTVLPSMALRFTAEGHAESIDHYLARLARACGCSPRQLSAIVHGRSTTVTYDQHFVGRLEEMTGQAGLASGTFIQVSGVIRGLRTRPGNARRWCPACYDAWDEASFEPLYWNLSGLEACPDHGVRLSDRCVTCGARQPTEQPYRSRRQCASCDHSLTAGISTPRDHEHEWSDKTLLDISYFCSNSSAEAIDTGRLGRRLMSLGNTDLATKSLYNAGWKGGRMSTATLLRACAALHLTPTELLADPEPSFTLRFPFEYGKVAECFLTNKTSRRRLQACANTMDALARAQSFALPVAVVCRSASAFAPSVRQWHTASFERYTQAHRHEFGSLCPVRLSRAAGRAVQLWQAAGSQDPGLSGIKDVADKLLLGRDVSPQTARDLAVAALRLVRLTRDRESAAPSGQEWNRFRPKRWRSSVRLQAVDGSGVDGAPFQPALFEGSEGNSHPIYLRRMRRQWSPVP
jgi:hypothetical protein